jgi:hypothetical protein
MASGVYQVYKFQLLLASKLNCKRFFFILKYTCYLSVSLIKDGGSTGNKREYGSRTEA